MVILSEEVIYMVKIPYAQSNGSLTAEVKLSYAADVFLVNESNFRKYQSGQRFEYYGGHYTKTPVRINVSGIGRWYLIVDGSDYQYQFI